MPPLNPFIPTQPVVSHLRKLIFSSTIKFSFQKRCLAYNSLPSNSSLRLQGKKVLITGASRGIGATIARRFANEGARCILVGRNEQALETVALSLNAADDSETSHGSQRETDARDWKENGHLVRAGNVGSREFWKEMAKEVRYSSTSTWFMYVVRG